MPQLGQEWASTHTASTSPTPNELHWAAGFLEGEGTFGFRGATAAIHAAQTDNLVPLGRLLALFGGSITTHRQGSSRRRGLRARDGEMWTVRGSRARGVMMTLYSILSPRRQQQICKALKQSTSQEYKELPKLVKLAPQQNTEIRRRYRKGERGVVASLAKEFGVSRQHIWYIATRTKGR